MLHPYTVCLLAPTPARSAVHVLRPDRFQPLAVRAARSAVHVLRTLAVLARCPVLFAPLTVRAAAWPCSPRPCSPPCAIVPVCARVWVRACARVRGRCPPTFQSLAVHFIRL